MSNTVCILHDYTDPSWTHSTMTDEQSSIWFILATFKKTTCLAAYDIIGAWQAFPHQKCEWVRERERQWEGLILRHVMWEESIKCILINWEGLIGASSNRSVKGVWAYRRLLGGDLPCSRVVLGGCRAVEEIAETLCCSTNSGASEWQHVRQPLHLPIAVCSSPWLPLHLFPHMERLVAWKTSWKNEKGKVTEAFRKDMAETETWLLFNCKWHIQEHSRTHTRLTHYSCNDSHQRHSFVHIHPSIKETSHLHYHRAIYCSSTTHNVFS